MTSPCPSCGVAERDTLLTHATIALMAKNRRLRLAMAQINVVVGDLDGNAAKIIEWMDKARAMEADIVTFPELALTGYPPEDLLLKPQFVEANLKVLDDVRRAATGLTAIVGFVNRRDDIYNAAAILGDGQLAGVYHKAYLPNYGVFDEFRLLSGRQAFPSGPDRRCANRSEHLRGHLVSGWSGCRSDSGRCRGAYQHLILPIPCREAALEGEDAGDPGR